MKSDGSRPVLRIPLTRLEKYLEAASILGLIYAISSAVYAITILPEIIPAQYGINGKPDGWGSRNGVFLFPGVSVIIYLMFTILSRFPHIYKYPVKITKENAGCQYLIGRHIIRWLKTEFIWVFAYVQTTFIKAAQSPNPRIGIAAPLIFILAAYATTIWYMRKSTRNQ